MGSRIVGPAERDTLGCAAIAGGFTSATLGVIVTGRIGYQFGGYLGAVLAAAALAAVLTLGFIRLGVHGGQR